MVGSKSKKVLAGVCATVMAVSAFSMSAFATDEVTLPDDSNFVPALDFNQEDLYKDGVDLPNGIIMGEKSGNTFADSFISSVIKTDYTTGNGLLIAPNPEVETPSWNLMFRTQKEDYTQNKFVDDDAVDGIKDLDANGLRFFIDTTGYGKAYSTYIMIDEFGCDETGAPRDEFTCWAAQNGFAILKDASGEVSESALSSSGIAFPEGFVGSVYVPLAAFIDSGWGSYTDGDEGIDLKNVLGILLNDAPADPSSSLIVDEIGFYGPEIKNFWAQDYKLGDVDNNGKVTGVDALNVLEYVASLKEFDETQMMAADVNKDTKVNGIDALWILEYVAGIRNEDFTSKTA